MLIEKPCHLITTPTHSILFQIKKEGLRSLVVIEPTAPLLNLCEHEKGART